MKIIKKLLTKNRCYTDPVKIHVKKLVLHSPGVAQPKAAGMIKAMNTPAATKSVHAFIQADGVIQTLPWDYHAWHVGMGSKGSYNSCAIGVEVCEPAGHTYKGGTMIGYNTARNKTYFEKVYNNAVELFAKLCYVYELNPLKDIVCHSEAHALGYASNHSDVMHWFQKHGKTMDDFRKDVKKKIEE